MHRSALQWNPWNAGMDLAISSPPTYTKAEPSLGKNSYFETLPTHTESHTKSQQVHLRAVVPPPYGTPVIHTPYPTQSGPQSTATASPDGQRLPTGISAERHSIVGAHEVHPPDVPQRSSNIVGQRLRSW